MSPGRHAGPPAPPPTLAELGAVHLVGVGGAGMSVVAVLLAARGVRVSGSDAKDSTMLDALRAAGVRVEVGHDAAHLGDAQTVVVSSAVRPTNPELAAAQERGLPVLHRSEALAALMADRRAVAVAGAHGKTTTSAMVAVVLERAGLDPSWAIGGAVLPTVDGSDAGSDAVADRAAADVLAGGRDGAGDVLVAEADESDGSFLAYRPTVAVVTNVEADHLDHYGSQQAFEDAFVAFTERIQPGGALVACVDDVGSRRLVGRVREALLARDVRVVTYGTATDADVVLRGFHAVGTGSTVTLAPAGSVPGARPGDPRELVLELAVPGAHNALNAAAAWTVARVLGVPGDAAAAALGTFRGTGRRFEQRGEAGGVRVVDDYAHHPTEVAALLRAARPAAQGGRVLVLFQPHLFSRTRTFAQEFADALGLADVAVVTDVYAAREDPDPTVSGRTITDRMGGAAGEYVADRLDAAARVAALARPGDLVLTVGAGDVTELGAVVLDALASRAGDDDTAGPTP